ncbi:IMP cyclohydrolase [Lacticaseibacillus rhamnosus]|uniref:IMP cyclohydrolase n=1 Tax=Lacticaseibacillus rhamnosus TaxID=47715 RepID=A0AAX0K461_LACRH|nr:IMP cyclohydrolase [Lacticaseibacillus rhamnosus]
MKRKIPAIIHSLSIIIDLTRNPVIITGSRSLSITRSPAQKSACKDPEAQWPKPGHYASYVPAYSHNVFPGAEVCV